MANRYLWVLVLTSVVLAACGKKADDALTVVSAPAAAPVTGAGTVIAPPVGARAGNANDQTTKKN